MTLALRHLGKKGEWGIKVGDYFSVNRDKSGAALQLPEIFKVGEMIVM
jgi:hypothetical protein